MIKKALKVNYLSVINMINNIENIKLKKFNYFLCLSTSHVFKKSLYKLKETSEKNLQIIMVYQKKDGRLCFIK